MLLSENDHVVQTVSADGTDQPLDVGPLPGACRSREDLLNAQAANTPAKVAPVDFVSISQQVAVRRRFRKSLDHLLAGPESCGMLRHVGVNDPSPMMGQYYEYAPPPKADRRHGEEIHRDHIPDVVVQEGPPSLGRGLPVPRHQAGNRALGDLDSQLEQFAVKAWRAPIGVRSRHPFD